MAFKLPELKSSLKCTWDTVASQSGNIVTVNTILFTVTKSIFYVLSVRVTPFKDNTPKTESYMYWMHWLITVWCIKLQTQKYRIYICVCLCFSFLYLLNPIQGGAGLEPIPAAIGLEAGYSFDGLPVHHRDTNRNTRIYIYIHPSIFICLSEVGSQR